MYTMIGCVSVYACRFYCMAMLPVFSLHLLALLVQVKGQICGYRRETMDKAICYEGLGTTVFLY